MRTTLEELDSTYGDELMEVYNYSVKGRINDFPRLVSYLHDRTCQDCKGKLNNGTFRIKVAIKHQSGYIEEEERTFQSIGHYLYMRPRGSGQLYPSEVRFVHAHCLDQHNRAKCEKVEMGTRWVPQDQGMI